MPTKQGGLDLLQDPVAQKLLQSTLPARLAYNWTDGTPRLVPIWFHWNGSEIVLGSPSDAPKFKVLKDGDKVALSIDSDTMPYKVLMVRGTVRLEPTDGITPEYASSARRVLGEAGGEGWLAQISALRANVTRVVVTPTWVGVIDFETRLPSAVERAMEKAQAGG